MSLSLDATPTLAHLILQRATLAQARETLALSHRTLQKKLHAPDTFTLAELKQLSTWLNVSRDELLRLIDHQLDHNLAPLPAAAGRPARL